MPSDRPSGAGARKIEEANESDSAQPGDSQIQADVDHKEYLEKIEGLQQCIRAMRSQLNRKVVEQENLHQQMRLEAVRYREMMKKLSIEHREELESKMRWANQQIANLSKAVRNLREKYEQHRASEGTQKLLSEQSFAQSKLKLQNMVSQLRELMAEKEVVYENDMTQWAKRLRESSDKQINKINLLDQELLAQEGRHQEHLRKKTKEFESKLRKKDNEIAEISARVSREESAIDQKRREQKDEYGKQIGVLKQEARKNRDNLETQVNYYKSLLQDEQLRNRSQVEELQKTLIRMRKYLTESKPEILEKLDSDKDEA